MNELSFYASGKLLLFGEYLVLRGAASLAVPLKMGQTLTITPSDKKGIIWKSYENRRGWFQARFSDTLQLISTTSDEPADTARKLLLHIQKLQPEMSLSHHELRFDLGFNRSFGWGTSSTLVSLLSQWADVDPYLLLDEVFGGSGYDIAAATASAPFIYRVEVDDGKKERYVRYVDLNHNITDHLLFIYLGKKQSSRKEVGAFGKKRVAEDQIKAMNEIVQNAVECTDITAFEQLMDDSEAMLSKILKTRSVKRRLFKHYPYSVKSLGAWGGDFIMATCRDIEDAKRYFWQKGMRIVYTYNEIVR